MLKFLQCVFTTDPMDNDDVEVEMINQLAYDCQQLVKKMDMEMHSEGRTALLLEYLKEVDSAHEPIQDFNTDLDWFNVTEPLFFENELKGKIVVLDFFTYCCINCMHVLPDLKRLEKRFSVEAGLVVIGVHSAKFDNEKDSSNILSAVQRYNITHPVVNDANSTMWSALKVSCWPTMVVLGPKANPLFVLMGEGNYDTLVSYVEAAITFYKVEGSLKKHSLPLNPATDLMVRSYLKFPGKMCCSKYNDDDTDQAELYAISDTGNHRILVINSNGDVLQKIGGISPGFVDGDFRVARFHSPQGVCFLNNDVIFVADTDNHALRRIDLKQRTVVTVAGTGEQGLDKIGGKPGLEQQFASPWDVAVYRTRDMDMSFHMDESAIPEKDIVLIAMAGTHQIWAYFTDDVIWWKFRKFQANTAAVIAGNGREENRNNTYANNASFAQPSGLALAKGTKYLYIADSESSSVRKLALSDGAVSAVVGGDRNTTDLFAYGDHDGHLFNAKLQHPLGVAYNSKRELLFVADTYNHKIKQIDVKTNTITTCHVMHYNERQEYTFNEPTGLCCSPSGDNVYVVDTNAHCIRVVKLNDNGDKMVSRPLKLNFNLQTTSKELGERLSFVPLKIRPDGGKIRLTITLHLLTDEVAFAADAPQKWNAYLPTESWYINQHNGLYRDAIELDVTAPGFTSSQQEQEIFTIGFKLNLCAERICFPKIFSIVFPVLYSEDGLDCIIEDVNVKVDRHNVEL